MALFNIDEFRNEVLGSGLARPNRFEVEIPVPSGLNNFYKQFGRLISLFCEETNFPPLIVSTKGYKIFGPSFQRPVSAEFGGEGISMTFHVDREMIVKRFFEEWCYSVIEPDTFLVGYQNEYVQDITIYQLDETDNVTYRCVLKDAFPRSINIMALNNSTQNQTHRLTVMFAYRYWTAVMDNETDSSIRNTVPFIPPEKSRSFARRPEENLPEKTARRQFNPTTGNLEGSPGSDLPISA